VAEKVSEDEEALDLFRHCTQLGNHVCILSVSQSIEDFCNGLTGTNCC